MYPGTYAQTTPDKPAVIMAGSGRTITYRELGDASRQLAVALHDLGLRPGDVVAMLSDNQADCLVIYWACLRSGLYLTAINHHLTADEAAYIAGDCDATVLIASASLSDLAVAVRGATP
jgi:fatty-acyl-CoA synthase